MEFKLIRSESREVRRASKTENSLVLQCDKFNFLGAIVETRGFELDITGRISTAWVNWRGASKEFRLKGHFVIRKQLVNKYSQT